MTDALAMDPAMGGLLALLVLALGVFSVAALRRRAPRPDQRPAQPRPDTEPLQQEAVREVDRHEATVDKIHDAAMNADGAEPDRPTPADVWNS